MIVFNVIEGSDLKDGLYKTFKVILHTEKKGDAQVITLTLEFEKLDVSVPWPTSFMDWFGQLHNLTLINTSWLYPES